MEGEWYLEEAIVSGVALNHPNCVGAPENHGEDLLCAHHSSQVNLLLAVDHHLPDVERDVTVSVPMEMTVRERVGT